MHIKPNRILFLLCEHLFIIYSIPTEHEDRRTDEEHTRNQLGPMEAVVLGPLKSIYSEQRTHSKAHSQRSRRRSPWEALWNIIVKYYIYCLPALLVLSLWLDTVIVIAARAPPGRCERMHN